LQHLLALKEVIGSKCNIKKVGEQRTVVPESKIT
jgi:hypothetical protein